ncbi:MAG: ATP-dependent Clp protease proteolytic subunit [Alphaproteobacteria bacterium]
MSKTAYIAFYSEVRALSLKNLTATIGKVPPKTETLYILITTGGGTVMHGMAAYELLKALPYKIIMHNIGSVDSIGNILFMAGDERYASSHATFLIHNVKCELTEGKFNNSLLQEKLTSIEADNRRIKDLLLEHTRLEVSTIDDYFVSGHTLDAKAALKKGLITKISDFQLPENQIVHAVPID